MPDDLTERLDRIERMLQRLLTAAAVRPAPRLPKRTRPDDPAITTRVVEAMAKSRERTG